MKSNDLWINARQRILVVDEVFVQLIFCLPSDKYYQTAQIWFINIYLNILGIFNHKMTIIWQWKHFNCRYYSMKICMNILCKKKLLSFHGTMVNLSFIFSSISLDLCLWVCLRGITPWVEIFTIDPLSLDPVFWVYICSSMRWWSLWLFPTT